MVSKTPYHQRPRLIGERLGNHFGDVDPDAKRVWALIVQLSVLFREKNNPKLKSEGIALSRGEIIILTALRLEGRPHELRQTDITERVQMSSGGVTNTCSALTSRGLIERTRDDFDSRVTLYRLTPDGVTLIDRVIPLIHDTEKALLACLSPEETARLCDYLERITQNF
jgi:DNA-binding MarR family transcriptional regulator